MGSGAFVKVTVVLSFDVRDSVFQKRNITLLPKEVLECREQLRQVPRRRSFDHNGRWSAGRVGSEMKLVIAKWR